MGDEMMHDELAAEMERDAKTEEEDNDMEDEGDEEDDMTEEELDDGGKQKRLGSADEAPETAEEDNDDEDDEKDDTAEEDNDEEDEEDDDDEDNEDGKTKKAVAQKVELSDSNSMLRMIRSLPEIEARRHEHFRRSHFERGAIKRCMAQAIQECTPSDKKVPTVTQVMAIVMAGMAKVFAGEITAEARRIMEKNGETGPIRPRHLREAHRKYYKRRPLARGRNLRRLLR